MPELMSPLSPSEAPLVDIHVVAGKLSAETLSKLELLGYDAKNVVGGDPRVQMEYLLSIKHRNLDKSDAVYTETLEICGADRDFYGYVEQEIISDDVKLRSTDLGGHSDFDIELEVSPCPEGIYKGCDLHFALSDVGPALRHTLETHGFYNLVLNKEGLGDITIFTMQLEQVVHGHRLWQFMLEYLKGLPNIDCDAKFEITRNLARFGGYPLPPLVLKETPPHIG